METCNTVVLTKQHLKKFIHALDCVGSPMDKDELISVKFLANTIVIETDDIVTIVKLENQ